MKEPAMARLLSINCLNDNQHMRHRRFVRDRDMDGRFHALRNHRLQPLFRAARKGEGGLARGRVYNADILHIDALIETRAKGLGAGFLGGKALGVSGDMGAARAAALGLLALCFCKTALDKAFAKALERLFDPAYIDQVAARADNHLVCPVTSLATLCTLWIWTFFFATFAPWTSW